MAVTAAVATTQSVVNGRLFRWPENARIAMGRSKSTKKIRVWNKTWNTASKVTQRGDETGWYT